MNIYNDSQATSATNYPTSATFTNIETQDVIIHNNLKITGATKGGIIICENTQNDIGELVLGPQDFVLAADQVSGLPIWRNNIIMNEIQTNQLKIPTIVQGDLLVGQNTSFMGRLPRGAVDTVLFSDGSNLGWLPRSAGNSFYENVGSANNIPLNTVGTIFNSNGLDLFAGKRYKFTISARILSQAATSFSLLINTFPIAVFNYVFNGDMSRTILYTAGSTGSVQIELTGSTDIVNSSILNFIITSEEF